mmetsp:Transcript_2283/g.4825  ORF Transcript_2283/g.4825 Transcript_2283/m.4825 type:complete len:90 (+) Transcript_2283:423-692(+)
MSSASSSASPPLSTFTSPKTDNRLNVSMRRVVLVVVVVTVMVVVVPVVVVAVIVVDVVVMVVVVGSQAGLLVSRFQKKLEADISEKHLQ